MERFEERYGVRIVQGWGMTETSPLAAVALPPRGVELGTAEEMDWRALTGRPLGGVELRIVDDAGNVLPWDGEAVGEIECGGPWITGAYYGDPSPEKFDDGWLRTGDVGSVTPERLRADHRPGQGRHQVGRRVDLVGRAREPPDGAPRRRRGGGHRGARSAVGRAPARVRRVPRGRGRECSRAARLPRAHVAKWQLPERWTFIDEVPKTSVGKFDKKVLRAAVRRRRARRRGALTPATSRRIPGAPMTTTLAASVFDRLGDDLWLLVPAFVFAMLASALIGRVLGVRRSFAASVISGMFGWVVGVVVALVIAVRRPPASDGFGRNLFLFTLFGAMAAAVWIEFLARPGIVLRAQTGLQSVPHPLRSLRRRGRRVQRYAEITRIAVRNGLGPSLGLGRKDDVDAAGAPSAGPPAPPRARGVRRACS